MIAKSEMGSSKLGSKLEKRRPSGVSRRQKRQFQFEALEDRRVMTGQTALAELVAPGASAIESPEPAQATVQSYSSDTPEGQLQQLMSELYWQSITLGANGSTNLAPRSIPTDPMLALQWHLIN
ncbi:MAG TPA: hypothetical protein VEQ85_16095 [Lacipirellulaceae bacterium]|nr:hypothetical protein [Lacipirellulaceae bacterium]